MWLLADFRHRLDECEQYMPGLRKDIHPDVPQYFWGTLQIQKLSWLTPDAMADIETELRDRDVTARRSVKTPHPSPSTLTLQGLYSDNIKIHVRVQGIKERNVVYLGCKICAFV